MVIQMRDYIKKQEDKEILTFQEKQEIIQEQQILNEIIRRKKIQNTFKLVQ